MFRTMLVEDSSSFRQVVKNDLQDQFPSMEIIEAADGAEAFQKIDGRPPNLIFMDISLPGENGLELTRKISGPPLTTSRHSRHPLQTAAAGGPGSAGMRPENKTGSCTP